MQDGSELSRLVSWKIERIGPGGQSGEVKCGICLLFGAISYYRGFVACSFEFHLVA